MTLTDEDALRDCLERAAPAELGAHMIAEITRSRFELVTSYDAYRLKVALAGGGELRLFLKDYGVSLRRKNDPKDRREREVQVYRELLADAGLGTARHYGSIMEEAAGRFWMLLEYVDGSPVGYGPPGPAWALAAEGLGRMHGHFARDPNRLRRCEALIRHDAEFFISTAERALRDVATIAPRLVSRLERWVRGYDRLVTEMTSHPPTLAHGGCRSSNILVGIAGQPERVCILDWEEASLGAGLFDVAHLVDGIQPPLLDELLEAYRRGATDYGMPLPPLADMKHAYECFRLHSAFSSLGRGVFKGYRERDVVKLLDYADGIGRAIHAAPRVRATRTAGAAVDVERIAAKAVGHAVEIGGWRSERSPVAVRGVFPIEVLRVSLVDGETLDVFVKYVGSEQADHPDTLRRDREPALYEQWLNGGDLPVPRFYGAHHDASTGRTAIHLEYIGDWSLAYQGMDSWLAVPPRLARLHAHFAQHAAALSGCEYLLRLDAAYFNAWAERALEVARRHAVHADAVAGVVHGYGAVADTLARQPATLVHNDLAPKNVLADRRVEPARICFVDWEMAGVGCGLLDLVHLIHGLDPASDRAMRDAYVAHLRGSELLPSDPGALGRLFTACELHHALYRLAHADVWRLPPDRIERSAAEVCALARPAEEERA